MRVVLCHRKNGLPSLFALSMNAFEWSTSTSSNVSMSYLEPGGPCCQPWWSAAMFLNGRKGPSSTIRCLPTRPQRGISVESSLSVAQQCTKLRGPYVWKKAGSDGKEYQYGSDIASRWYR